MLPVDLLISIVHMTLLPSSFYGEICYGIRLYHTRIWTQTLYTEGVYRTFSTPDETSCYQCHRPQSLYQIDVA